MGSMLPKEHFGVAISTVFGNASPCDPRSAIILDASPNSKHALLLVSSAGRRRRAASGECGVMPNGDPKACRDVSQGKMPGSLWTMLHLEARLSARDVETICAAAQAGASR